MLFHGSTEVIEKPEFDKGNPFNDYGLGFYCTEDKELAKEWACKTLEGGIANKYTINIDGLDILNLSLERYGVLSWLAVLLENRTFEIGNPVASRAREYLLENFLPDYKTRDVIIGYRADDSYFSFAKAFLNGAIPLEALERAMRLGKLGEQVCLKSSRAFNLLQFIEPILVNGTVYFAKRMTRDNQAREQYQRLLVEPQQTDKDAVFIIDIIRQHWTNDNARL